MRARDRRRDYPVPCPRHAHRVSLTIAARSLHRRPFLSQVRVPQGRALIQTNMCDAGEAHKSSGARRKIVAGTTLALCKPAALALLPRALRVSHTRVILKYERPHIPFFILPCSDTTPVAVALPQISSEGGRSSRTDSLRHHAQARATRPPPPLGLASPGRHLLRLREMARFDMSLDTSLAWLTCFGAVSARLATLPRGRSPPGSPPHVALWLVSRARLATRPTGSLGSSARGSPEHLHVPRAALLAHGASWLAVQVSRRRMARLGSA